MAVGCSAREQDVGGGPADLVHGLAHRRERGHQLGGEGHVVVAHHRHVARDLHPAQAQLAHDAEGDDVVDAEEGRGGVLFGRHHLDEPALPVVGAHGGQVPDDEHGLGVETRLDDRLPRSLEPLARLLQLLGSAEVGDAAVPLLEQVADGLPGPGHAVGTHRGERGTVRVEQHRGDAQARDRRQVLGGVLGRRHQQPADPLLGEQPQPAALAVGVLVGAGHHQHQAVGEEAVLDAAGERGVEGVAQVEHDRADHGRLAGAQLARGCVAHEVELGHRRLDALAGLLGHRLGAVQHVRHGAHRHARPLRDGLDACPACCHSASFPRVRSHSRAGSFHPHPLTTPPGGRRSAQAGLRRIPRGGVDAQRAG